MKDIKSVIGDDRVRYHNDLSSDEIKMDDLVYAWDFFMEMAVWTDSKIQEKAIEEDKK